MEDVRESRVSGCLTSRQYIMPHRGARTANILKSRLLPIQESLDHESQCDFRPGRGCADVVFAVKTALRKRREHGLETWVMFLDLVKAFDRVPRELL